MKINWIEEKETLEKLINEGVSYECIGRKYGITGNGIKKAAKKIGIILPRKRSINPNEHFNKGKRSKKYYCQYCGKICKNANSQTNHEILCRENPNRQISYGNHGNMPKHINRYYVSKYKTRNGDVLDKTKYEIEEYAKEHIHCEICGKTVEESNKWDSPYAPKQLCVDHDHKTLKFRGMLCSTCNRQLGWYEKYREHIETYLNKNNEGALG